MHQCGNKLADQHHHYHLDHRDDDDYDDHNVDFSGNELADLGPEAKGWLSAKYCIYPQVIMM